jgi:hypothetical protein
LQILAESDWLILAESDWLTSLNVKTLLFVAIAAMLGGVYGSNT